ncbi:uncharacterized protein LOC142559401 [Dermacentor variabilis]|uniref:uncharacterized protein LOC142559401 n=1 Tax=Dermacentor variabilis TaxID=34621 RepID=UPI003F5C83FC
MSSEYDPHHPWPLSALAQFVKIRENQGYHQIYKSVANEETGPWVNMEYLTPSYHKFKIWTGYDVILSRHMSEEDEQNYRPPSSPSFDLPGSLQPPGSSVVTLLQCQRPEEDTNVGIDTIGDGSVDYINYGKNVLFENQLYFVYVRNSSNRWTISTSFNPQPKTIAHKSAKRAIYFHRPSNSYQKRMTQNGLRELCRKSRSSVGDEDFWSTIWHQDVIDEKFRHFGCAAFR